MTTLIEFSWLQQGRPAGSRKKWNFGNAAKLYAMYKTTTTEQQLNYKDCRCCG